MSNYTPDVAGPVSAGTGFLDWSVPLSGNRPQTLWQNNLIIARVNGRRQVITSAQYDELIMNGEDVEVISPGSRVG
jgi:hypothetical protein